MKTKLYLFLCLLFGLTASISCSDDSNGPADPPGLSVSPNTPIAFTATATESFEIAVTTNQPSWKAVSSQPWCIITPGENKFTVTALPNTLAAAPVPATITVSAGEATNVTISVTQAGANFVPPTNAEELKSYIAQSWLFPETSDYISLEFTKEGQYSLLGRKPFVRSTEATTYLLTDNYTVGNDLKTLSLNNFGTIVISEFKSAEMNLSVTPTGGTATTVLTTRQTLKDPVPSADKHIKKIDFVEDPSTGRIAATYKFEYTSNKLSQVIFSGEEDDETYSYVCDIKYSGNIVSMSLPGEALGKDCNIMRIDYILGTSGLANTLKFYYDDSYIGMTNYTYNSSRELIAYREFDQAGKLESYATAQWNSEGNITSIYRWGKLDWDEDKNGIPDNDYNGSGEIDEGDKIESWEDRITKITYSSYKTKSNFIAPNIIPAIYRANDVFDFIALNIGIAGKATTNMLTCFDRGAEAEETFTYTVNNEGYPTRLTIIDGRAPANDNTFYMDFLFE